MDRQLYLSKEYEVCHSKVSKAVDELQKVEIYAILGAGGIYAWFFALQGENESVAAKTASALWIVPVLVILAGYRAIMKLKYIESICVYLRLIELEFATDVRSGSVWKYIGWETWFVKNGPRTWNRGFRLFFWGAAFVSSLVIASKFGIESPEVISGSK